ncbi:hypothetical protein DERP_007637 [Dermatophagoides pteronyssinus]|uniref:Uncharacterized protein n=1 Tax=Dermatophagoides pteronyssinus TaxID=6956 RepID=A0ABQ8JKW6_DERPT|nr:hypothetical protein DERP_007637 [Dermatophagoides pteronyssinus]
MSKKREYQKLLDNMKLCFNHEDSKCNNIFLYGWIVEYFYVYVVVFFQMVHKHEGIVENEN